MRTHMLSTWSTVLQGDQGSQCTCEMTRLSNATKQLVVTVRDIEGESTAEVKGILETTERGIYLHQIEIEDETVDLNALLIRADPKQGQKWTTTASEKIKVRTVGTVNVTVDVEIEVLGLSGGIRLAVESDVVVKKRLIPIPLKSMQLQVEVLLDASDFSPLEVDIKDGESFSRLVV